MQWNAQISKSDSRKQMLLWILSRKYDLVYEKTFPLPGGIVSPCIRETLILRLSPLFESCRSLYPACGGLFILHILSTRTRHHQHLISLFHLWVFVCLCVCMNVSIISHPVQVCQLHFSSAPLFFLNVIVECSSEMNLHTCILTEGNTIGYILLTPCVVWLFNIHTFLPEHSSSLQLNTNPLRG